MGLAESELDPVSEQNPGPVLERRDAVDRLAGNADRAESLDQVGFPVAANPGVPLRKVAQNRHVHAPYRLAENHLLGQADPVAADRIDPQHESVVRTVVPSSHGVEILK